MDLDWKLIHDITEWVIRLVMIPVVAREHRSQVALAWLGVIFFAPWIGLVLYLLFGELNLRRSVRQHARVRESVEAVQRLRASAPHLVGPELPPEHQPLARMAQTLTSELDGGVPAIGGNQVRLFTDSAEAMERILADINGAERHVHLLFFLFNDDATGRRVAEALARAVQRGVTCRLLVDSFGSRVVAKPSFFRHLHPWLEERGVEVRTTLPLRLLRRPLSRFDIRNHRKIVVVDGRIGYTGSLNIHNPAFALESGIWHQMMVRVEGPATLQMQILFAEDWTFSAQQELEGDDIYPELDALGDTPVQVIPDGPTYGTDFLQHVLVAAIDTARERLVITTPYFVPDTALLVALRLAALRGVRVDLILPARSDRRTADAVARSYFSVLLETGVHIHLYPDGLLHAKSMSVDGELAIVGSANYDRRSLFLNYEASLIVYDRAIARQLLEAQEVFLGAASEVSRSWWPEQPRTRRIVLQTSKLLSPIM